jgi:hypothetical protein
LGVLAVLGLIALILLNLARSQDQIVAVFTITYVLSSWIGAILFTIIWGLTHRDRKQLAREPVVDRRVARLRMAAAWRNEYIGGVMALAFWLYSIAGAIAVIRILELIPLPWEEGLVTTFLLVTGNFVEMTVAIALVVARISMNRERD